MGAGRCRAASDRELTLASRPPASSASDSRGASPLYYPDRAALYAEVEATLSPKSRLQEGPICLEPCSPSASPVFGAPVESLEGAREFISAAADWVERGAKSGTPMKEGASIVADYFKNQVSVIERRAKKEMVRAFKAAGNQYSVAFATEAVEIKRNAIRMIEKIDAPMSWFGIAPSESKFTLRNLERQGKRLVRNYEYGAAKQLKDAQRAANKVIELPIGSTILSNWATRFGYLTIVVDVGPAFFKLVTAKDDNERKSAQTEFAAEFFGAGANLAVGSALAIVLSLTPVGWVTLGVGVPFTTVLSFAAGEYVKERIHPTDDK